jgi:hypothetical protein
MLKKSVPDLFSENGRSAAPHLSGNQALPGSISERCAPALRWQVAEMIFSNLPAVVT